MKRPFTISLLLSLLILLPSSLLAQETTHHTMEILLQPERHLIEVEDTITLPKALYPNKGEKRYFILHRGLNPVSITRGVKISGVKEGALSPQAGVDAHLLLSARDPLLELYAVNLPQGKRSFTLKYKDTIHHPLQQQMGESDRSFRETPGLISPDGVYLAGSSHWYPWFGKEMVTFSMNVTVPQGWHAVSQGERTVYKHEGRRAQAGWQEERPQDQIYLVAGQLTEYIKQAGPVSLSVLLRNRDEMLAQKYLETGAQYLAMYTELIGPYPYGKFALVENFWETGYGMPSFTLMGPQVIRFPFILHSSYPHEILHNWWGNGVFVDFESGNWSEGLTAYLADHLIKEQRGQGVEYRLTTLQKYLDYVAGGKDFPLTEFWSRHSPATEAVGYGKTMFFFHMLRLQLGDDLFTRALRQFYSDNKFTLATFEDLQDTFSAVSGRELKTEFDQWIRRTGAPELRVRDAHTTVEGEGFRLTAVIEQIHEGPAYRLRIPVAVHLKDSEEAFQTTIPMDTKVMEISLHLPALPLRLDIDPEFDIFRRLDRNEIPPALSQAFGADTALIVLPSTAPEELRKEYRRLAETWQQSPTRKIEIKLDSDIDRLPKDRTVWLFGRENRFTPQVASALTGYGVITRAGTVRIRSNELDTGNRSLVLTTRHPDNPERALVWLTADNMEAIPGLGRKLPHYGKYSYLAFEGSEPSNVLKGRWPTVNSPLSVPVRQPDGTFYRGAVTAELAPRRALAYLPPLFSEERMMEVIRFLAAEERKGRGFGTPELDRAAEFIAARFRDAGLQPAGDGKGSYFQEWKARGGEPEREAAMKNVIAVIPGSRPEWEGQSVVVGAHYDHLGLGWPDVRAINRGKVHPGADDNASGVAVLLELARLLGKSWRPDRSVVFIAFTGEEAERMGSKFYVENERRFPADRTIGVLNLDTVGRLGSNRLLMLGSGSAREWVHIFMGAGYVTGVPIEPVPDDFGSSDQKSFLDAGVPAVQLFSGPHTDLHSPADTSDRVDSAGLVKVASVVREAVEYLAHRPEPLSSLLEVKGGVLAKKTEAPGRGRKVGLGTIPDFTYRDRGVRIIGAIPGSPAEKAGLQKGDIIILINNKPVDDLRSYSNILKGLKPGDTVMITLLRGGKEKRVEAQVVER